MYATQQQRMFCGIDNNLKQVKILSLLRLGVNVRYLIVGSPDLMHFANLQDPPQDLPTRKIGQARKGICRYANSPTKSQLL